MSHLINKQLSICLVLSSMILSNLVYASTEQQRIVKRQGIETDPATAGKLLENNKVLYNEYLKYINGIDVSAQEFVDWKMKNPSVKTEDYVSERIVVHFVELGMRNKPAILQAAKYLLKNSTTKEVLKLDPFYIGATSLLISDNHVKEPTKDQIKAMEYLINSDSDGKRLLSVNVPTLSHVEAVLALWAKPGPDNYNTNPLQKPSAEAVEAIESVNRTIDTQHRIGAKKELLWAIRKGYSNHTPGTVPTCILIVEKSFDDPAPGYKFTELWAKSNAPEITADRIKVNELKTVAKIKVLNKVMSTNRSKLKTTGLALNSYVVVDDIANDITTEDTVLIIGADQH